MLDKNYDLTGARKSKMPCSTSCENLQYIGNALEQSAVESHGAEEDDRLGTLFRVKIMSYQKLHGLTTVYNSLAGHQLIFRQIHYPRDGESIKLALVEEERRL
jgi:hypothetical protein